MKQDIEIIRGTSKTIPVTVTDADKAAYTLKDGEKIIFGVKKKPEQDECLVKKIITECTDGVCSVVFTPEDTEALPPGKYFYDMGLLSGADYFPVIACENRKLQEFHILPNITSKGDGA